MASCFGCELRRWKLLVFIDFFCDCYCAEKQETALFVSYECQEIILSGIYWKYKSACIAHFSVGMKNSTRKSGNPPGKSSADGHVCILHTGNVGTDEVSFNFGSFELLWGSELMLCWWNRKGCLKRKYLVCSIFCEWYEKLWWSFFLRGGALSENNLFRIYLTWS